MLFPQIRLPVPEGPNYECFSPRKGDVYLRYRVRSFHVNGKKKHERIAIGRVFEDELTKLKYFCPNENYYLKLLKKPVPQGVRGKSKGRQKIQDNRSELIADSSEPKGFGYMLACWSVVKELGLDVMLEESFGSLCRSIVAAASFFAAGAPGGLSNIDNFTRRNMCFTSEVIDSGALCELYSNLNAPLRTDFFRRWVKSCCEDDYLCYDVTSVSNYSDSLPGVAWGYNRDKERLPQLNLGMFCSMKKGLPVFFCPYNGSINEFANFSYITEQAKSVGILKTRKITWVMDGVFAVPRTFENAVSHGFELLIGAPAGFGVKIKESLLDWRCSATCDDTFFVMPDNESIRYHVIPLTIEQVTCNLMMFYSPKMALLEEENLNAAIFRMKAKLKGSKQISAQEARQYREYFDIRFNEDGSSFSWQLNQEAYSKALRLSGCFALLGTRDDISCKEALQIFRAKDLAEKVLESLKSDIPGDRLHSQTIEEHCGKLFLAFIGLIIRKALEGKLSSYLNKNRMGLDSAFCRLSNLKCVKREGTWILDNALTKQERELAELFKLPIGSF